MRYFTAFVIGLLITPLCFAKAETATEEFANLEKRTGGRIGLVAMDAAANKRVEYRGQERFLMCSTFKVLAVAAVLKRVDEKKEKLDRFVPYGEAQLLIYAPVTRAHVKEGGMTVEALCAAAISPSDNTAGNLLLETIGGPKGLTEFARSLGDEMTHLDRTEPELNVAVPGEDHDSTTPAAMCKNLQRLLTSDVLSQESRTRLEGWMAGNETGLKMIRASAPADWKVGDKTGRSGDGACNDIAILRPPSGGPLFLAIYVNAPGQSSDGRDTLVAEVAKIAIELLARAENSRAGPCATASSRSAVCEAANSYALERMKASNLEAIMVMQDVRTGALIAFAASDPAKMDVTTAVLPLSPVKLMAAASWLEHGGGAQAESEKLLTDSIVSGNDNAGRQIALAVRRAAGTEKVLEDLARYGFPAGEKIDADFWAELAPRWRTTLVPSAACHSLGKEATDQDWENTLSIGEERFVATALHLSRFLQAVGNGGVLLGPSARDEESKERPGSTIPATRVMSEQAALKLQTLMRGTVERGTAKSAAPILAGTRWSMGGKTGTGPAPGTTDPGPGSNGCFAGLIFDAEGKARFTVVTFVNHGGFGGGNAARLSAELARFLSGE
jgi:beta-lactamase class A